MIQEVEHIKDELVQLEQGIEKNRQTAKDADQKVKELEKEMKEFSSNKDAKLKSIEVWSIGRDGINYHDFKL